MPQMIEVVIDSVRVSLMSAQRVVILRQVDGNFFMPIWVGAAEAEAITVALQEVELARPLTHDLLKNTITLFNAVLQRIEIVALKEDIFYATLIIERDGHTMSLDSRPSDAIALAVRIHAPIFVSNEVMAEAGITPDKDIQEEASLQAGHLPSEDIPADDLADLPPEETAGGKKTPTSRRSRALPPSDQKRLDVFEDFLKTLGKDKPADSSGDEKKPKE